MLPDNNIPNQTIHGSTFVILDLLEYKYSGLSRFTHLKTVSCSSDSSTHRTSWLKTQGDSKTISHSSRRGVLPRTSFFIREKESYGSKARGIAQRKANVLLSNKSHLLLNSLSRLVNSRRVFSSRLRREYVGAGITCSFLDDTQPTERARRDQLQCLCIASPLGEHGY